MASSSLKKETPPTMHLRDLVKDVEDFEKRLRRRIEWTNQSIGKLPIDCELNCSRIRQEFKAFIDNARMKAGELCDQMKEKTTEKQRKWRQSLEEKEKFLLGGDDDNDDNDDNDDEDVFSGVELLGAELSWWHHKSSTPVEEGQFVVTFPEWCQRSLDQLQKEIVEFTVQTWPPRELELQSEYRLQGLNKETIWSIAVSDEDGHVFVADWGGRDYTIKEFAQTGKVVSRYLLKYERHNILTPGHLSSF